MALLVAGFVATPAIDSDNLRNMVAGALIAASVILFSDYQRLSGVRVRRIGFSGAALLVGLVVGTMLLLSASYGLVSLLPPWWVLAPAMLCFVLILAGGRRFDHLYRESLRRGH